MDRTPLERFMPPRVLLLLLPLLSLACAKDPPDKDSTEPDDTALPEVTYMSAECPEGIEGADCGQVTLPEKAGGTSTINLSTAILRATGGSSSAPLVLFTGGPGSKVFELAALFGPGAPFGRLNVDHDLVLIAERGTFGAEPFLGCPELAEVDDAFYLPPKEKGAITLDAWAACHDRLVNEGIDLSAYTNAQRAADVPLALQAMGFESWHLWGVSGGALLVQILVRDHPQGIVTAMLDSGAFPTAHMAPVATDLLANVQARLDRMFEECAADAPCNEAFPSFEEDLFTLVDSLDADPRELMVTHPVSGETHEIALNGELLLQLYADNMSSVALLPLVTSLTLAGDFSVVESVLPAAMVSYSGDSFSDGLYASVFCADLGGVELDDIDDAGVDEGHDTGFGQGPWNRRQSW